MTTAQVGPADLTGSVAIVTGAARGIGRTIAATLAERGARVASVDVTDSKETVEQITAAGGEAMQVEADLTAEQEVADAFAEVTGRHGRLDVLVNNAGVYIGVERRPFWEIDADEWDWVMRVNVRSVFLCAKEASATLRRQRSGRIVNIASNVVTFGMANHLHYVTSKAAVIGMTRSLARELGPYGVAVNGVAPGLVTTEATQQAIPAEYRQQVADGQCLTEPLYPDDIAQAVAYLSSSAARLVTGQTLLVNGGATMGPA